MAAAKTKQSLEFLQRSYKEYIEQCEDIPSSFALNWYLSGLRELKELELLYTVFFEYTEKKTIYKYIKYDYI